MGNALLASRTIRLHYARGALGLLAFAAAIAGAAAGVPAALVLVAVAVVAWRGCPTCWALGLMQTREHGTCVDGRCRS